jgi:endonuclease-3
MHSLGVKRIEKLIASINFFHNKAKNIHACCKRLIDDFKSEVPKNLEELVTLPGVGRKTANVVLGNAFDTPGMVVDTHVLRLSNRFQFAKSMDAVKMELLLGDLVNRDDWVAYSHLLILHGRKTCKALKPDCCHCQVAKLCPSSGNEANAWKSI